MVYINNEMPLYIHEVRALTHVAVLRLLDMQPESPDGMPRIDLTHTLLNTDCRAALLDVVADLFYYFDDHARDNLHISFPTYADYTHKILIYFKEDLDSIGGMSRDLIVSIADLFIATLRVIRMLFNIEFTLTAAVAHSSPEEGAYAFLPTGLQNVLAKILDRLNEVYFNGKSQYLAHVGDVSVSRRRGVAGGICVHMGYLLAHHSKSPRGQLYDESWRTLLAPTVVTSMLHAHYIDDEKIPIILDNSAFELGESITPAELIEWYNKLSTDGFIKKGEWEFVPVLPDVLGDHESTLKMSSEFLGSILEAQRARPIESKPFDPEAAVSYMVVVQDSKPEEGEVLSTQSIVSKRIKNLIAMVSSTVTSIMKSKNGTYVGPDPLSVWVGMPMMRYSPSGELLFDRSGGEIRANTLNAIAADIPLIKKKICKEVEKSYPECQIESSDLLLNFHILGCISPAEYKFLTKEATKLIASLDTSFPFSTAINQEEAFLLSKMKPASGIVPTRPWHFGRKMRLKDIKPFSMTLLTPQLTNPHDEAGLEGHDELLIAEGDAASISEASRINAARFTVYQLDMWVSRLRHMAINQRMFEEWVSSVWVDD
ncbi:MAG: hypothetical protein LC650_04035 [Actinobacteria bacterium]|nr:hypothetical protein [Actinomycetota bacterium]